MIWQDKGYLLSQYKYNENSVIANFYTEKHGKVSGIIFGATSKKIKNYLIIGNRFYLNYKSKNENSIGSFLVELEEYKTPIYFENKKKLFCIIYSMNLIKILTAENQSNIKIFVLIENLFNILKKNKWLIDFIFWELNFFKKIGYDINYKDYVINLKEYDENKYVVKERKKLIPNFLIDKNYEAKNTSEILEALKINGDFLDKTILKNNNLKFPTSRNDFINSLKL
mgnify:CR=1 FL=1